MCGTVHKHYRTMRHPFRMSLYLYTAVFSDSRNSATLSSFSGGDALFLGATLVVRLLPTIGLALPIWIRVLTVLNN